jgi:hypothetical protein
MPPKKGKKDPNAKKNKAATPIQCVIRKFLARVKVRRVAKKTWIRVFDPAFKMYFFYNKNTGASLWTVPKFMEMFYPEDEAAGLSIGKVVRGFNGRVRARAEVFRQYTRYFDFNVGKHYWINHDSEETFWRATPWLLKQEVRGFLSLFLFIVARMHACHHIILCVSNHHPSLPPFLNLSTFIHHRCQCHWRIRCCTRVGTESRNWYVSS